MYFYTKIAQMLPADYLSAMYYIDEHFCFLQYIQKKWLEIFH